MYTAIHSPPDCALQIVCEHEQLHPVIEASIAYLKKLDQAYSETDMVVTVWRADALVAVVTDDARGLRACVLAPYRKGVYT